MMIALDILYHILNIRKNIWGSKPMLQPKAAAAQDPFHKSGQARHQHHLGWGMGMLPIRKDMIHHDPPYPIV